MHLTMLLSILALACLWRWVKTQAPTQNWHDQWRHMLVLLLLPPLLLFVSSIAILRMGPHGWMVWGWEGWISYILAIAFLGFALFCLGQMTIKGHCILAQIRTYRQIELNNSIARVLNISAPFIAQIGFWYPELVVSQGLLDTLNPDQLEAVMAHEQAHYRYRDTFWFFWLGWLRQISGWLPNSQVIWENLLVLRELRADRWAAHRTDSLLLAETLLLVVQVTVIEDNYCAAFNHVASPDRLSQRIDALIAAPKLIEPKGWWQWGWLLISLLPLLAVPLHG
jgi:Zn-dependent protease with chaperone function